jgi:hypothetical protein
MDFYDDFLHGPAEQYLDDGAFRLVSAPLPAWYINSDLKLAFPNRSA